MKELAKRSARATFDLTPEAKHKLATMKNDLRLIGLRATERSIILALIGSANLEQVAKQLQDEQVRSAVAEHP